QPGLIRGDLADLVLRRQPGRTNESERTAFIFRGLGLADPAVAGLALTEAEKANVGRVVDDEE
ncbi:MAG TPA: hypothetical protein VFK56_03850, partial [Mycobacterium sp.]|nr:hypothetical protein [Mycobacterium sp.]